MTVNWNSRYQRLQMKNVFWGYYIFFAVIYEKTYDLLKTSEIYFIKWSTINCDVVQCKKSACGWQISAEIFDIYTGLYKGILWIKFR